MALLGGGRGTSNTQVLPAQVLSAAKAQSLGAEGSTRSLGTKSPSLISVPSPAKENHIECLLMTLLAGASSSRSLQKDRRRSYSPTCPCGLATEGSAGRYAGEGPASVPAISHSSLAHSLSAAPRRPICSEVVRRSLRSSHPNKKKPDRVANRLLIPCTSCTIPNTSVTVSILAQGRAACRH